MTAIDSDLRIDWRPLTVLEISYRSVWTNVFWYVKVYMFWKCIQYTIHWDKTQTPFGQNKRYKKCPLFSFARSSPFYFIAVLFLICDSYMSWSTRFVSLKLCVGFSIFRFRFVFIKVYNFVQENAWTLWL